MAGFKSLELDDEDKLDYAAPMPVDTPDYPYGMRICLTGRELKKLQIDDLPEKGDYLMMTIIACVTSVSTSDNEMGSDCRIELQIEKAKALEGDENAAEAFAEDETEEGEL